MNHKLSVGIFVLSIFCVGLILLIGYRINTSRNTQSGGSIRPSSEQTSSPESTPTPVSQAELQTKYKDFIRNVVVTSVPNRLSPYAETFFVKGEARGTWFFEASFPIELQDEQKKSIAVGHAQAATEWMTEDFVPFTATIDYSPTESKIGFLILKKDNPSGEPQFDDEFVVPVQFAP